ncbi:hypothetical protein [Botrimarina sp.]|uniref:hypothetical protein n=1 Tax=Botrimarina sp. TaxID=2795802 RepID=UPI0032EFAF8A
MDRRQLALVAGAVAACLLGCSSSTTTVPNPFNTADRVPPPPLRAGAPPAAASPYYPQAPGYPQAPATFAPQPAAPAASPAPGSATPVYGDQVAPPAYPNYQGADAGRSPSGSQLAASGEAIAVPGDNSSVRFGSPNRPAAAPTTEALASNGQGDVVGGWIAGSAPVRGANAASPRVRLPGETGVESPLRVASPGGSTTGWR